jgi:GAF domain-containing protein
LRLATAFEAITDLYMLTTPLSGLQFTVELLGRLVPCEAISGCLYDVETDEFRFVALSGAGAVERKASAVRASAGLFGAAQRREALLVSDVAEEPRYNAAIDGRPLLHVRNVAYVRVRHQGQLLGMLQLINAAAPTGFAQSDVPVLTYIAAQLGEFLANCRALTV